MKNMDIIREAMKGLGSVQKSILRSLYSSSKQMDEFNSVKSAISSLIDRGLVNVEEHQVSLTNLGKSVCELWQGGNNKELKSTESTQKVTQKKVQSLSKREKAKQEKLEKSKDFLELYKQGFSYQQIGDQHGISRERVRQILRVNPEFDDYLKEKERLKTAAIAREEREKQERLEQENYSRSLAAMYPEKVTELWDDEKNGNLKPEQVLAGTVGQYIWLKCPSDGYFWKKRPNDITTIWARNGTSGCPKCAGKTKKRKKQPPLAEIYPELVEQYWNFEKNKELRLDPEKLSLGSNKKAWFKCPIDLNEWQASIASTVNQQWSKGNAGCRICNGTFERKRGRWKRRDPIAVEFPEEVAKYWFYKANDELKIDPMQLTSGSSKEAFFKCPVDNYEWVATLASVRSSWKRGNSGCPQCAGRIEKYQKQSSLLNTYPTFVKEYWDYEKNEELRLDPSKISTGSSKQAWFKCPTDGYEWRTRIGGLATSSWSVGNNGCARCGSGWTLEAIRQFVASLEEHIPNLTQAELYKIFEQSGILDSKNSEGLKIVKGIIKGKLSGQKLRSFTQRSKSTSEEDVADANDDLLTDTELQVVDSESGSINDPSSKFSNDKSTSSKEDEPSLDLPKVKVQKSLEFLSSQVVASADQEAIDFFIASRRNRIWAEVFEDESAVEAIEEFTDEGYGRQVRDEFLDEYNQARDMKLPSGWAFRVNGKVTPPNLRQKLAAVRLRSQRRMLNLSLTGTGKTIGGILSSRIIDAHLTVIICPLDTISNWHGEIKHVFPDSLVTIKNFNPHWQDTENGHHYIILNHEMFQQPSTAERIRQLLDRFQIDLVVVDEIHRCKQRGDNPSKRRQMVLALITNAAEQNPNLHVLGMSATPVINNLKEGKSLVELVTGLERADLGERATINNCMRLHQAFVTLGIRSRVKPRIKIKRVTLPVECNELVEEIRQEGTSILKMEQILTRARIPAILRELRPKTIVYTHYVEGIVKQLQEAIEAAGWTVGFHLGGNKSGRNDFINGSTDILIASSAMATGVDGFQKVCDRLILNIPPWTSAELEQLEGRLNRQGQSHDTLTILMPVTYGLDNGKRWSWDEGRLARLQNKQTVADAAVDGVMPEGQLRTESQAFRDLRKWLERLKTGEQKSITRPKIFVPLPETNLVEVKRRYAQYGDFSRMNAR